MFGSSNNLDIRQSISLQSLASALSDDSFQREVTEKTQMYFIGKQEAEIEVQLDRIIRKEGNKDKALLYIVSEIDNESKGANPSARDSSSWTPLHFAVKRQFKGVCGKLLENDARPDARDKTGVMPYTLAYESRNDVICAMLLTKMDNKVVRKLHVSDGVKPAQFSFKNLILNDMQRTVLAVLDCMIEHKTPSREQVVYYHLLESDENGMTPEHPGFNTSSKSPLHIIARSRNKTIVYHDVVRLLIRKKWKEYARLRFQATSIMYVLSLIALSFAGVTAASTSNPKTYDTPLQVARAVFEFWSLGMAFLTLTGEINQFKKHKLEYFSDAFNWVEFLSSSLIIVILPLRLTDRNEQWHVFSVGYLLWTLRIFKYAAVFRQTGAYAQILWRILVHDFLQFTITFTVILLAFSGSFFLALRGESSINTFEETSSFWQILFVGVRVLIEGESVIEYTTFKPMSCILMVIFLFIILVLLVNILIAQLSDTYQNVQQDAHRGLEVNRAWIVAHVELNRLYACKDYRTMYYKESEEIYDIHDALEKWETPPLNEINKYIQDVWESMESHKLNLQTVQNRLARQESALTKIQETLDRLSSHISHQENEENEASTSTAPF